MGRNANAARPRVLALVSAAALGTACGGDIAPAPARQQQAARQPVTEAPVVQELGARGAATVPAPVIQRNPFRFERNSGGGDASGDMRELPSGETLPELPLPIPQPPLRLLGIATDDNDTRIAVISVGGDLVLAKVGDRLANRFLVAQISADSVSLIDSIGQLPMRLALP